MNITVFPIDLKKVPFSLQDKVKSFKEYIQYLLRSNLAMVKPGLVQ